MLSRWCAAALFSRCAVRLHSFPVRPFVGQAVAAGLAEAAEEPLLCDVPRLVEQPLRLLVLLAIPLDLPREVLIRLLLVAIALPSPS